MRYTFNPATVAKPMPRIAGLTAGILMCLTLSSCVSSTVTTTSQEPITPTSELALTQEEQRSIKLRNEAIAEIHAKADAMPENKEAPDYGLPKQGETTALTPQQIVAETARIRAAAGITTTGASEAELAARQNRINRLRQLGDSHYDSAMKKIVQ